MQRAARFFAKLPWIGQVALLIAPAAIAWNINIESQRPAHDWGGRDFTNYWMGSRLLFDHRIADIFQPSRYIHVMELAGIDRWPPLSFSYPPTMLPLVAWTGLLPYNAAFVIWSTLGLAALFAAAWPYSRKPWVAAAILGSHAVLGCLDFGQNGLFTSALLVGALTRIDRRPLLAGVLIGLLTAKPQLGLLLPVALLAARRWKVIAAATASALGLLAMSLLLAGPEAWRMYISDTLPFQGALFHNNYSGWATITPSPIIGVVSAGGSWRMAFVIQAALTLAMIGLITAVFVRRGRNPITDLDRIILLGATFLASPYSFNYDMAGLGVCLLIASSARPELDASSAWRWSALSLWSAPLVLAIVGAVGLHQPHHHWPPVGALMIAAGVALVLWVQSRQAIVGGGRRLLDVVRQTRTLSPNAL